MCILIESHRNALSNFNYMALWKSRCYSDRKKISVCGVGVMKGGAQKISRAEIILWCYHNVGRRHCNCPNPQHLQHWGGIVIWTVDFAWLLCVYIRSSTVTNITWWGMLMIGEAMYLWRQEVYGTPLYFPFDFPMYLKLCSKIKSYIEIKNKGTVIRGEGEGTNRGK